MEHLTGPAGNKNTIRISVSDRGYRAATALLGAGELVAFPTETVYGLGADARNPRAVARIFAAKGRPSFNPLIVHVADADAARALVRVPEAAEPLMSAFWPGPLTLVLPIRSDSGIADLVTAGLSTLAVRVPEHPVAVALLRAFGGPVAAPSANPSGKISATTADHVIDGLEGKIAAVIDAGPTGVGVESTILGFDETGQATLLRHGGLPLEAIEDLIGPVRIAPPGGTLTAPGQMASHYAPDAQLVLDADPRSAPPEALWLAFGPLGGREGITLSETGDLVEAAARLFAALHDIDARARAQGVSVIHVDAVPETGLGRAINDRLRRAAAPRG